MSDIFTLCISIEGENFCNCVSETKIEGITFKPLPSLAFTNLKSDSVFVEFGADFENPERFQGKRILIFYYFQGEQIRKKMNVKKMLVYKISTSSSIIALECVSLEFLLSLGRANFFSLNCRCNFGDKYCKLDVSHFAVKGTVEKYLKQTNQIYDSKLNFENPERFANGKLKIGNFTFIVLVIENCKIKIINELGIEVKEGQEYTLIAGCDKTLKTCKEVYKNSINFQGEPFIFEKFSSSVF